MPQITETSWPRNKVSSIETRNRDIVVRISDWWRDRDEPAYDVEVYIAGVYDWNESKAFAASDGLTKSQAKAAAAKFAAEQIAKHLL